MSSLVTRPSYIRQRLADEDIQPSKAMGQNFLADGNIMELIVEALGIQPDDHVVEIGPGLGALTVSLLRQAAQVTCIEKDEKLAALLAEEFATRPHFSIRNEDALETDFNQLLAEPSTKVISNLPYSVGTRIVMTLLQVEMLPKRMVFMLQKDVAEKFAARPGCKTYGLTAVWSQRLYDVELIHTVSPNCFIPPPRIASGVLRMSRRDTPLADVDHRQDFERLTRFAFEHRRKQMGKILQEYPGYSGSREDGDRILDSLDLTSRLRPEDLSPKQWGELSNRVHS